MSDRLDGKLRIVFEDGKVAARMSLAPGLDEGDISFETLIALLQERSVARGSIDDDAVRGLLEAYDPSAEAGANAIVARGQPPIDGEDGRLDLEPDIAEALEETRKRIETAEEEAERLAQEAAEGDGEAISFYDQSAFCMVKSGQRIATVVPPTDGEDGIDVTGMVLLPKPGKSFQLKEHESIAVSPEGAVTSRCSGFVKHDYDSVQVLQTLEIPGNVDFSTGNISGFDGDVLVRKGVKDKFRVEAGGDVEIGELVEASHLATGGDLRLSRGMAGREKGTLQVGRDLRARYLDAVSGSVRRDAHISSELTNTELSIGRSLVAPAGTMIGGRLEVVRCCELAQAGSEGGAATEIVLGKLPEQERLAQEAFELAPALENRLAKSRERLQQLQTGAAKLTSQQAEELTELQFEIASSEEKIEPLRNKMAELVRGIDRLATEPSLVIHKALHAGVVLVIGAYRCEIDTAVTGPVRIDLDAGGEPRLRTLTNDTTRPLSAVARVIRDGRFVDLNEIRESCAAEQAGDDDQSGQQSGDQVSDQGPLAA